MPKNLGRISDSKDIANKEYIDDLISKFYIEGTGTTAGTWLGTSEKITEYKTGIMVLYKIPVAGASTTTLNINGLGAKRCYRNSTSALTTHFGTGYVVAMVYDETLNSNAGGWRCVADYDSTDINRLRMYYARYFAGENPIYRYKLCAEDNQGRLQPLTLENSTGTTKTVNTKGFYPERIYYYNTTTTVAANGAIGHGTLDFSSYLTNTNYTFNSTISTYKNIYLKGTYDKSTDLFTLDNTDETSWYVQVPNNTAFNASDYFDTAHQYIYLGTSYSSNNYMYIFPIHTMYSFNGTALVEYCANELTLKADANHNHNSSYAPVVHRHDNASASVDGFMSASDKTNLNTLVGLLADNDSDTTVNTIREVLNAFASYPEGTSIANALAGKSDTSHTHPQYITDHQDISGKVNRSGDTMTGTLEFTPNAKEIELRPAHASYNGTISYQTAGNEAVCFQVQNPVTSWIFKTGNTFGTADWYATTPSLQIKNQKVAINKLIANGAESAYNLDVGGTANATTIYENGTALSSKYLGINAVSDWAKNSSKPTYTASEVGLGNVNNTSDANKPISTATQTALNSKLDKTSVTGTVIGTSKTLSKVAEQVLLNSGAVFGGSAAAAGLVTRGICGVSTPDGNGSCSKENLYINYDGTNTYGSGRQVVLQAGSVGTHYGNNLYQYAAARGDAVKGWVEAQGYVKSSVFSLSGTTLTISI